MEGKKISFGFTKTKKVEKPVVAERKEYIECLEEKSIKVVGGEVIEEKAPLVIAMKPNTLITAERLKQIAEEVEKGAEEVPAPGDNAPKEDSKPGENETIDQMAVRELLNEAKQEKKVEGPVLTVAVPSQPVLDGQKESTLEDYDAVPIQEFGMAMLRGMGWTASKEQQLKHKQPELRPKGLGLGADKVIKENQKKNVSKDKKDEELSIVKNSFVKITTGKYSGLYGKVVSLDEDNGRVMVDITIKKETVSLSEFMMQPVSKSEYDKQSKVINADSYEEYKKKENQKSNRDSKREKEDREASSSHREKERESDRSRKEDRSRKDKEESNGRHKQERYRSRSRSIDRHRRKHKKRYSSNSSISSDERTKKKEKRYSSDSSDSDDHRERRKTEKRDIDKKRKGKKKKRDRDRSPNYRKHRK